MFASLVMVEAACMYALTHHQFSMSMYFRECVVSLTPSKSCGLRVRSRNSLQQKKGIKGLEPMLFDLAFGFGGRPRNHRQAILFVLDR